MAVIDCLETLSLNSEITEKDVSDYHCSLAKQEEMSVCHDGLLSNGQLFFILKLSFRGKQEEV